jgi:Transposase DDE domain group 1
LETVEVATDGDGLVSHAWAALICDVADRVGLTSALSEALASTRERRSTHDPGRVVRDAAVVVADGGDCVSELEGLPPGAAVGQARRRRARTGVLKPIDEELPAGLRRARATARALAWDAGARPQALTLEVDATIIDAHSEKEEAAGTYDPSEAYDQRNGCAAGCPPALNWPVPQRFPWGRRSAS